MFDKRIEDSSSNILQNVAKKALTSLRDELWDVVVFISIWTKIPRRSRMVWAGCGGPAPRGAVYLY